MNSRWSELQPASAGSIASRSIPAGFGYAYEKKAARGNRESPGQKPAQISSASAPRRAMSPAPGGGSAPRPEKLVLARSKVPQKKSTRDVPPRNRDVRPFATTSPCDSPLQKRLAHSGS